MWVGFARSLPGDTVGDCRMRRLCWITTFAVHMLAVSQAVAVPPPGAAIGWQSARIARWVEHRVIPGERLQEIGERYRVEVREILEWNGIDAGKEVDAARRPAAQDLDRGGGDRAQAPFDHGS